ncbi:MAG: hypothetical protein AAGF11_36435 [Myxococcota bacterium]
MGLIFFFIFTASFLWLVERLEELRDRQSTLELALEEVERARRDFCSASVQDTYKGIVTSAGPLLHAPISGRECIAYRIEFGYVEDAHTIATDPYYAEHKATPFLLNGGLHICLRDQRFRFCPTDAAHRYEYQPNQFHPSLRDQLSSLFDAATRSKTSWYQGRFYEWILPPNSRCEISGEVTSEPLDYRHAGSLEIRNARIHVGSSEGDPTMKDELSRIQATIRARIRRIWLSRCLDYAISFSLMAYGGWIFWQPFRAIL